MLVALAFDALLAVALLLAIARGKSAERVAAVISVLGAVATAVGTEPIAARFLGASERLIAIDTAVAVAYCAVAVRSSKFWPIWASACQILAAAGAFEIGFSAHGWTVPAALNEQVWGWPPLLMIILASVEARRATQRHWTLSRPS